MFGLDLFAIPIIASNCLGEDEIWFFAPDAFLLACIHECFEIVCLGMFIRAIPARISTTISHFDKLDEAQVQLTSRTCEEQVLLYQAALSSNIEECSLRWHE